MSSCPHRHLTPVQVAVRCEATPVATGVLRQMISKASMEFTAPVGRKWGVKMRRMWGVAGSILIALTSIAACGSTEQTGSGQAAETSTQAPTTPSASESPSPTIEKQTITETQTIPFTKKTIKDASLANGTREVRTKGVNGVKTLTYL
jgi:G5 domain